MAFPQLSLSYYEDIKLMSDRFKKAYPTLVFNDNTSLFGLDTVNEAFKSATETRNDLAVKLDAAIIDTPEKQAALEKYAASFKIQVGEKFGKESDEYVWAGGIRPSEIAEKVRRTREENKLEREANAATRKAEKAQEKANEALKAAAEAKQKAGLM
jgi:hypothetical protein